MNSNIQAFIYLALFQEWSLCWVDFVAECTGVAQVPYSFGPQLPHLREDDNPSSVGDKSLIRCSEGPGAMVKGEPGGIAPAEEPKFRARGFPDSNGTEKKRKLEYLKPRR